MGGCLSFTPRYPKESSEATLTEFLKHGEDNRRQFLEDENKEVGPGTGFRGDELLSKDELNVLLDLEDELERMGQFRLIYPRAATAYQYYGFHEEKRYQNALYCAWLSTPVSTRK